MSAENVEVAYIVVAVLWAIVMGIFDGVMVQSDRSAFARGVLGAPVWPLVLLWWARPSWLWRDDPAADRVLAAEMEAQRLFAEVERLRAELAERGGFR